MDINKLVSDELAKQHQINSFTKGMNSDTSYDLLDSALYIFGKNIRVTNNVLLGGTLSSNNTELVIAPVSSGTDVTITNTDQDVVSILFTDAIENTGCIIVKIAGETTGTYHWRLYKAVYSASQDLITLTTLYESHNNIGDISKISATLIRETEGVLKVYIADGVNPVMCLFLENNEIGVDADLEAYYGAITDDRYLCSGQYFPYNKPRLSKISGNLKTLLAQYTYRLYRRYGCVSKLCPFTNKIQIVGTNHTIELGMAEDTVTDIGMELKIPINDVQKTLFNYIQIFRISFVKYGQTPDVELICDKKLNTTTISSADWFIFDDTGTDSLATYSLEEFSAILTLLIIPQIVEQNLNYLFAANVEDRTTIDESEVSGFTEDIEIVKCGIDLDDTGYDNVPTVTGSYTANSGKIKTLLGTEICSVDAYFNDCGVSTTITKLSYEDAFVSSLLRSLKSGSEKYLYGIVYYDKYGNHSDVKPVDLLTTSTDSLFSTEGEASVLGVKVTITKPNNYSGDIIGFLIVRCEKSFDYTKNILQVALSRPMRQGKFLQPTYRTPYYPNIYLSSLFFYTFYGVLHNMHVNHKIIQGSPQVVYSIGAPMIGTSWTDTKYIGKNLWQNDYTTDDEWQYFDNSGTNVENHSLFLIFSSEINIRRNDVLSSISGANCWFAISDYFYENRSLEQSVNSMCASSIQEMFKIAIYKSVTSGTSFDDIDFDDSLLTYENVQTAGSGLNEREWSGFKLTSSFNNSNDEYVLIPSGSSGKYFFNTSANITSEWYDFESSTGVIQLHKDTSNPTKTIIINANLENLASIVFDVYKISYVATIATDNYTLGIKIDETITSVGNCLYGITSGDIGTIMPHNCTIFSDLETGTATDDSTDGSVHTLSSGVYLSIKSNQVYKKSEKSSQHTVLKLKCRYNTTQNNVIETLNILNAADVKNPNWDNAFSDLLMTGSGTNIVVGSAIKQYKQYSTNVGGKNYNNWASNGMYDMAASKTEADSLLGNAKRLNDGRTDVPLYVFGQTIDNSESPHRHTDSLGFIGPGPVCLLTNIEKPTDGSVLRKQIKPVIDNTATDRLGTLVATIQHTSKDYNAQLLPYYGFGNFFTLSTSGNTTEKCVFDGDTYPMYAEFVNLFKTYDFNEKYSTIPSGQIVYYIPLESKINTYFDYGCNYRNTQSNNLMLEPGQITGVATQSRPLHQYNMVYSDNDMSIDVYYAAPEKKAEVKYPLRICYSLLKTNGEAIDNYQIFKPANFIDTDSRYGKITELLANDNTLYYWLTGAFGKLSVNERSLVTDNQGETIQLGQGGVLNRTDYISTQYGMRERDFSAISTEDALYWIDIQNKAILMCKLNQVVNYGEALNVQNLINSGIINEASEEQTEAETPEQTVPYIHYDLQNNELLCKCLSNSEQLVFNTKYGVATSVYHRTYDDAIVFNNVLVSLTNGTNGITAKKINYLISSNNASFLSPTVIEFVVNSYPYQTKVYDNQKVVILKKDRTASTNPLLPAYLEKEHSPFIDGYMTNREYKFETDLHSITERKPEAVTDREGNICYSFPRTTSENKERNSSTYDNRYSYGGRMRGKWMKETITNNSPSEDYCVSMIITKFRQSYN